jgi:2-succinyl-5-enolpyruvyl-6-hydroxy-3-cyclohexene-1-carboxylate synthase
VNLFSQLKKNSVQYNKMNLKTAVSFKGRNFAEALSWGTLYSQVTLLIGDVSFLHDTNGLSILRERYEYPVY